MKKKLLLTSILSIVMCFSLIVGATFALFTSESTVNVAVTSGTVKVTASVKSWEYKTLTKTTWQDGGALDGTIEFDNIGGTAEIDSTGKVTLSKIVPGDAIKLNFQITNDSDVTIKYRAKVLNKSTDDVLFNALAIGVDGSTFVGESSTAWATLTNGADVENALELVIELPEGAKGADLMGQTCELQVFVEAIQGNAETVNETVVNKDVEVDETDNTVKENTTITNDSADATIPAGAEVEDGTKSLTLIVKETAVDPNLVANVGGDKAVAVDVEIPEIADTNTEVIKVTLKKLLDANITDDITLYHSGVKMAQKATINELTNADTFYYDYNTGDVTIAVDNFSVFTAVVSEIKHDLVIGTLDELKAFRDDVNAGNSYAGKKVALSNNIDLAGKEWTPIGNGTNKFQGTFNGNGYTISNLVITGNNSDVGLFGFTAGGEIKNLTVENAKVSGYLNVGVVAGTPYTSKYTNVTVKGLVEVEGFSYVGGVGGKNAYANWTGVTVAADEGSYVKAYSINNDSAWRTYVGGVVGFMGEGGHKFTNVTSNIDVTGSTCDVGGIVGIAHYGNSFINCSSSGNVKITHATETGDAEEIGGIAGVWNNGGADVTFEGCSFTGTLSVNFTDGVDLSDNTITGKAYSTSGNGNLIIK